MSTPTTTRATGVITVRSYEPAPYDEPSGPGEVGAGGRDQRRELPPVLAKEHLLRG